MRAVVQRVTSAQVTVDGTVCAQIGRGLVVLIGVEVGDSSEDARLIAHKVAHLRIFEDGAGKMNLSVKEVDGAVLLVSQFTLLGDARKGNRPSFTLSAHPDEAELLFAETRDRIKDEGLTVQTGMFGAAMEVGLVNAGPVTIILDTRRSLERE